MVNDDVYFGFTQATLGLGAAKIRSILQCNVGKKSPVFLCTLYPVNSESLQLNLEFEEADDVVFSVLGPRSIFLSGYYVSTSQRYPFVVRALVLIMTRHYLILTFVIS